MSAGQVMLLTPQGGGAIAVVRLAGPAVELFLRRYFDRPAAVGRAVYGRLSDGQTEIDDCLVYLSGRAETTSGKTPHPALTPEYRGEGKENGVVSEQVLSDDGLRADINLHGGPWVVQATLNLAQANGFALVSHQPGQPLPALAVDGDSALQRDVLRYLPLASTQLAITTLLAQVDAWTEMARGNDRPAGIEDDHALRHLLNPPRVAIIGLPNVGKSTLANQLFAHERCITADMPGTTRDWVGQLADIDGLAVFLMDTPGQRDTADLVEKQAIAHSTQQVRSADLVVVVLDPTQNNETEQRELLAGHPSGLVVVNKTDRPAKWNASVAGGLNVVATRGDGIAAFRRAIAQRCGCLDLEIRVPRCWTDQQRELLTNPQALRHYCGLS